jgi:hypothetical protein
VLDNLLSVDRQRQRLAHLGVETPEGADIAQNELLPIDPLENELLPIDPLENGIGQNRKPGGAKLGFCSAPIAAVRRIAFIRTKSTRSGR